MNQNQKLLLLSTEYQWDAEILQTIEIHCTELRHRNSAPAKMKKKISKKLYKFTALN